MKAMLLSLSLVGSVQAADVILGTEPCTATNICFNVPNNSGLTIDYISDAIQYKRLVISVNGEIYDSGIYTLNGQLNQSNVPLYAGNGQVLYATLQFTVKTGPCVREGRVTECPRFVTLVGGSLIL
jgi:hypothetical protein